MLFDRFESKVLVVLFASTISAICFSQTSGGLPPLPNDSGQRPPTEAHSPLQSTPQAAPLSNRHRATDSSRNNDAVLVETAERRENLKVCMTGKYPALCNHTLLNATELDSVSQAERRENLKTCLNGKYPALCRHELLTQEEQQRVFSSEKRENFTTCISGKYRALCKHELLSREEAVQVDAAERRENRKLCLDGRYPALCDRQLLN